jgi:DNA recombination-dependent growth factor C
MKENRPTVDLLNANRSKISKIDNKKTSAPNVANQTGIKEEISMKLLPVGETQLVQTSRR